MILFIHSFQVLNTLSCMVLTAVNADVGGHFNLVIRLLVFRRRRSRMGQFTMSWRGQRFYGISPKIFIIFLNFVSKSIFKGRNALYEYDIANLLAT